MFVIWYLVLAVISAVQIRGTNLMLNKPSIQSGTFTYGDVIHDSSRANDGDKSGYPSSTAQQQNPFWQGDLQGFYTVTSISVTSTTYYGWGEDLRKAIIGVGCSEGEVTRCGQWPDESLPGHTIVFNCSHPGSVRFVKIWREGTDYLSLGEVEVEGLPKRLTGSETRSCCKKRYDKVIQQKVITPTKSLSVTNAMDCSATCYRTQFCLAFSYSPSEQPNCLLATDVGMTSDMKWGSYKVL